MGHLSGTVLVADDEPANLAVLTRLVKRLGCRVVSAADGQAALDAVGRERPDLVLLDVNMPRRDGFEVCRSIKQHPPTRLLPVVLITGLSASDDRIRGIVAGADDFVSKPFDSGELEARVRSLVQLKHHTDGLDSAASVVLSLARTIEARDPYTSGHCERLAEYATAHGRWLGLDGGPCRALYRGGFLHDIGKIGIPDAILLKTGPLTEQELEIIRRHAVIGAGILSGSRFDLLQTAERIALTHHEHWNGRGYPAALAGDAIPVEGRIVSVADALDSLTNDRPYRKACSLQDALEEIIRWRGRQFPPEVVDALCRLHRGGQLLEANIGPAFARVSGRVAG
jgi:putative two-component system response regulator